MPVWETPKEADQVETQRKNSRYWAVLGRVAVVISGVWVGVVLGYILSLLTGLIQICG